MSFRDLRRDGFSPGSTSVPMNSIPVAATGAESLPLEVASGGTAGKPNNLTSSTILTWGRRHTL